LSSKFIEISPSGLFFVAFFLAGGRDPALSRLRLLARRR
jgi:hypothetical protein